MKKLILLMMSFNLFTSTFSQIQISKNTVWNKIEDLPVGYEKGFEITNDANVIIRNIKLGLKPGAQITVQAGCYLRISESKIFCTDSTQQWRGIVVKGNDKAPQAIEPLNGVRPQGVLILKGNPSPNEKAYMELCDAEIGIEVEPGGIVQALMTRFTNCPKGVVIRPYAQPKNLCIFEQCVFSWESFNSLSNTVIKPQGYMAEFRHIELGADYNNKSGVNGVTISECMFSNLLNPDGLFIANIAQLGKGIYANDSYYFTNKAHIYDRGVLNPPAPSRVNTFYNLYQGICFFGSSAQGDLDANMNDFFNCKLDVTHCNVLN